MTDARPGPRSADRLARPESEAAGELPPPRGCHAPREARPPPFRAHNQSSDRKGDEEHVDQFRGAQLPSHGHGKGYRLRGASVTVCKGFDGEVAVLRDGRELPVRLLADGEDPPPGEDGKSVRLRVDRPKAEQRSRPAWNLTGDHPWRRPLKPGADGVAAG